MGTGQVMNENTQKRVMPAALGADIISRFGATSMFAAALNRDPRQSAGPLAGRFAAIPAAQNGLFLAIISVISACSVVKTTADVASTAVITTAKVATTVAGTTVDVAKGAVATGAVVGSASVAAASTAKSLALSTASVAISGVSLVGSAVMWGIQMKKSDDFSHAPVTSSGGGRFVSVEGKVLETEGCIETAPQVPGVLVHSKRGDVEVRAGGNTCKVLRIAG